MGGQKVVYPLLAMSLQAMLTGEHSYFGTGREVTIYRAAVCDVICL